MKAYFKALAVLASAAVLGLAFVFWIIFVSSAGWPLVLELAAVGGPVLALIAWPLSAMYR